VSYIADIEYGQFVQLKVASRDQYGRVNSRKLSTVDLKAPVSQTFLLSRLLDQAVRISGCVIPGFDPVKNRKKDCQDDYEIFEKNGTLLAVLFDGHGSNGHLVSSFCKESIGSYFLSKSEKFEISAKTAIEEMIIKCDEELKKSNIDTSLSGSTAVVLYINSNGIHVGSVGDSRAVLSTIPKSLADYHKSSSKSSSKFNRVIVPVRNLQAIALTVDQKPNHSQELKRIQTAGGEVRRIADELGNPLGPYRVWIKNETTPGLAMSRSIGDKIASSIGVISKPILNSFKMYPNIDQFIVIASDGIWDVMENIEVVNFVEKFRMNCMGRDNSIIYPAKVNNSSIARLLCEEARYRWFGILESEDVCVDDISCIIIELTGVDPSISDNYFAETEDRHHQAVFTSLAVEGVVKINREKAARNDPTRGSMADEETRMLAEALK
jgi:serine/threonine protein phosphatase PrpC